MADWTPLLAGLATLVTAIGGVWLIVSNARSQQKVEEGNKQERTIEGIWELVEDLKKERVRCDERIAVLERRVKELEDRIGK